MPKTALVTGSAGFVGRHMVQTLADRGYSVDRWDVADPITGSRDCMNLFLEGEETYDLVVHAAASSPNRKAIDTEPEHFPYNVMLDAAMFSWATHVKPGKVVYLSSSAVYAPDGRPLPYREDECDLNRPHMPPDVYGWTKFNGEQMARQARKAGLDVLVVRPFSGYGEDQSADFPFNAIVERTRRLEDPITVWGSGKQVRDWIHIDDICNAIMVLLTGPGGTVNLCTGIGTSIEQLAYIASALVDYHPAVMPIGGGHAGVDYRVGDPTLLNLIYTPRITLRQGIQRRLEAY